MRHRIPLTERFWKRVERSDGCWLWAGKRDAGGYGVLQESGPRRTNRKAHRVSWMIHHGDIPTGLCVLHKCDVPPCVNPEHLFLGTFKDNTRDMMAKGRARFGNPHGRPKLTVEQVAHIRKHLALRVLSVMELATLYRLTRGAIYHIAQGRTWRSA